MRSRVLRIPTIRMALRQQADGLMLRQERLLMGLQITMPLKSTLKSPKEEFTLSANRARQEISCSTMPTEMLLTTWALTHHLFSSLVITTTTHLQRICVSAFTRAVVLAIPISILPIPMMGRKGNRCSAMSTQTKQAIRTTDSQVTLSMRMNRCL